MINEGEPPRDDIGHGTHVAGVIAAPVTTRKAIAGMILVQRIMPVKVLDETGTGSTYSVARASYGQPTTGPK